MLGELGFVIRKDTGVSDRFKYRSITKIDRVVDGAFFG
jgi:hypothetical protein